MAEVLAAVARYGLSLCWQLTVVVGLAWTISAILGEHRAGHRYRLWLLVLARLSIPVVLVTPIGLLPQQTPVGKPAGAGPFTVRAPAIEAPEVEPLAPSGGATIDPADRDEPSRPLLPLLTLSWLGGVAGLSWVSVRRHRRLLVEVERAPASSGPLAEFVERQRRELGLRHPVRVRLMPATATTTGPALVGLVSPVVVVPDHFDSHWQESVHGPLLLHELIHLVRRDQWLNLAVTTTRVLYFFHPAAWVATSQLVRARERVCDDAVVRHYGSSGGLYVRALCRHGLSLPSGRPSALCVPLARRRSDLVRRVERLVRADRRPAGALAVLVVLGLGTLVSAVAADRVGAFGEEPTGAAIDRPLSPEVERLTRELEGSAEEPKSMSEMTAIALELVRKHPTMPDEVSQLAAGVLVGSPFEKAGREAWLTHLEHHPDDPAVLSNAVRLLQWTDPDRAELLLQRGRTLQPTAWWWPAQLGRLRQRRAGSEPDERSVATLETAAADLASALDLSPPPVARVRLLGQAARLALKIGRVDEAEALATRQLAEAPTIAGTWYEGNAIHIGRLTLGEVALLRGDPTRAAQWLIAAADVPSSPQLASSGPNTVLAEQLLERGTREPVLRYLEAWRRVWNYDRGRLDTWAADIRAGRTPAFGANRLHHL